MGPSHQLIKLGQWLVPRLSLPLLALNGWVLLRLIDYFKTPLTVLTVSAVLAFLLEYPLGWIERYRVKRLPAVLLLAFAITVLLGVLGVTLFPLLSQQMQDLISNFPTWQQSAHQQIQTFHNWLQSLGVPLQVSGLATQVSDQISRQIEAIANRIPGFLQETISSIFEVFLIVVVTIYLLLKGKTLWTGIFAWLPGKLGQQIQISLPRSFRNYFIGQGTIALLLGSLIALALTLFSIPYGFLFGVFIGTLSLFPYGGMVGITLVTLLLSLKNIGLGLTVLAIATCVDQIVESGIAPRLMGHLTGIHPVWVVMVILMGGKVAGLMGVLMAVPIASTVKEVMEIYKPSRREDHP